MGLSSDAGRLRHDSVLLFLLLPYSRRCRLSKETRMPDVQHDAYAIQPDRTSRPSEYAEDAISLRPLFDALWNYRSVIGLVAAVTSVLGGLVLFALYLRAPVERIGSIEFRLLFEGAANNQYPNGTAFSESEIVAAPVLTEIFHVNDLQRFGKYENFKASMFVLASNPEVDLLTYEYQAKLADARLTATDRARIEEEFRTKRRSLVDPVFSLNMRRHEGLTTMPTDLIQKVVHDTLATWAKHAYERKGATRYNVPMLSKDILRRDVIDREDYLVAIDILRTKTTRIIETIDTLAELPGAHAIRTGSAQTSLAEVRSTLEDVLRFRLEPLLDLVRSEGVTKNARELSLYANNQLFQLRLQRQKSQNLVTTLQESLNAYSANRGSASGRDTAPGTGTIGGPSIVPQLDQSFLDRLMMFSTASEDQKYRRELTDRIIVESERVGALQREAAYYEDLVKNLPSVGSRAIGAPQTIALINARTTEAFEQVSLAADQISALHAELSAQNLNPSTTLYAITGPFTVRTTRSMTGRSALLSLFLITLVALIGASLAAVVHSVVRGQKGFRPATE